MATEPNDDELYYRFKQEVERVELLASNEEEEKQESGFDPRSVRPDIRPAQHFVNYRRAENVDTENMIPNLHSNAEWQRLPFFQRRRYLQVLMRNLLMLDHLLVALLLPFSTYNILKVLFSEVTFSEYDFAAEILRYWRTTQVVDDQSVLQGLLPDGAQLLNKFHNIVLLFCVPAFDAWNSNFGSSLYAARVFSASIKFTTLALYLSYGITASTYLCFATFFFSLCFLITFFRRYKYVERVLSYMYQTSGKVF
ncbi:LAMI_0B01068g1_1 [Lachancea mirantina]|uniref:LAMI_0B01068g1_1 n=1 Tax=Lachancea mirantina TaxID=1230905 RepID=A0A1G4ITG7_9SACH|nr:LAMI_0B01068g1_1 [Lachancea mirantina]